MPPAHRFAAAGLIGASGTFVMLVMLRPQLGGEWPFFLAASIGAGVSGYGAAGLFGHPGWRGVGLGVLGAVLATVCGAALAGLGLGLVVAQTLVGAVMGPMAVGQALMTSPPALVTWIVTMAVAQLVMALVRRANLMPS